MYVPIAQKDDPRGLQNVNCEKKTRNLKAVNDRACSRRRTDQNLKRRPQNTIKKEMHMYQEHFFQIAKKNDISINLIAENEVP